MPVVDQPSPVTTSEQQAVPVAQWFAWPSRKTWEEVRVELRSRDGSVWQELASDFQYWINSAAGDMCDDVVAFRIVDETPLSHPCKSGEGAGVAIPADIAEHVLSLGRVEWGQTHAHDAEGHGRHVADSVRITAANFGQDGDQRMHGLWLAGTETVLCHTGTSPNAPKTTQAIVGAWNWLVDQASGAPVPDATQTREAEGKAWHCPELRDLFNDAERLRNHELGDSRWMELMRGALDMLKAADTELACDDAIITAALNARGDA